MDYEFENDNDARDSYNQLPLLLKGYTQSIKSIPNANINYIRETIVYNTYPQAFGIRHKELVYLNSRNGYSLILPPESWNKKYGYISNDWHYQGQLFNIYKDKGQKNNLLLNPRRPRGYRNGIPLLWQQIVTALKRLLKSIQTKPESPRFLPTCSYKRDVEIQKIIDRCH